MDRSYLAENDAARERLRSLVARLTDEELRQPVGHGWTAAATLAHLAFWDRRTLERLEEWERSGVQIVPTDPDPINDGLLPEWLAMDPREAARAAVAAAEAVDAKVASLSGELVAEILARRPRTLVRATHRLDHLAEIERALGAGHAG